MSPKGGGQNVDGKVDQQVKISSAVSSNNPPLDHDVSASNVEVVDDGNIVKDLWEALESDWPQQTPTSQWIVTVPRSTLYVTREEEDKYLNKYYLPKVVSIGPYHYGEDHLKQIQDLKLRFARDLLLKEGKSKREELRRNLYNDRPLLKRLRGYYDEERNKKFDDKAFADMMFLDGCFILYYIRLSCGKYFETKGMLLNHQMISIRQDLLLLENQIPFEVLEIVMHQLSKEACEKDIQRFIDESTFSSPTLTDQEKPAYDRNKGINPDHLLHLLLLNLTINCSNGAKPPSAGISDHHSIHMQRALPKVKELMNAGIRFKTNNTRSLCQIDFSIHWWHMLRPAARVKLPPIIVEEASTKYLFLNLIAYEASSHRPTDMWVTSYICLLNSLISKSKDVKALRDAGVFGDSEGSDSEIKEVINEIAAAGRAPDDSLAYFEAKTNIRKFYDRFKSFNTPISEFKDKYFNSPWSFLALVGAILALFLTAVQTYFTLIKGECDDLCKFLKLNHHL